MVATNKNGEPFETGRPSGYSPEFCEVIIDAGRAGDFKKTWGLGCKSEANPHGVTLQALHVWKTEHREFFEAFEIAELLFEKYWSELNKAQATEYPCPSEGRGARNNNAVKFVLSACCGYREKTDVVSTNTHRVAVADWGDESSQN